MAQDAISLICDISTTESYLSQKRRTHNETIDISIIESEPIKISTSGGELFFYFYGKSILPIGNQVITLQIMDNSNGDNFNVIKYEDSDPKKNHYIESIEINRYSGKFIYSKLVSGFYIKSEGNCKKVDKKF